MVILFGVVFFKAGLFGTVDEPGFTTPYCWIGSFPLLKSDFGDDGGLEDGGVVFLTASDFLTGEDFELLYHSLPAPIPAAKRPAPTANNLPFPLSLLEALTNVLPTLFSATLVTFSATFSAPFLTTGVVFLTTGVVLTVAFSSVVAFFFGAGVVFDVVALTGVSDLTGVAGVTGGVFLKTFFIAP